jgi:plastocyanin domain-containing protein
MSLRQGFLFSKLSAQEHYPIRIKKKKKGFIPCFMKVNLGCFSIEKTNDSASVVPKKLASKSRENISYLVVYKCSILEIIKKRY